MWFEKRAPLTNRNDEFVKFHRKSESNSTKRLWLEPEPRNAWSIAILQFSISRHFVTLFFVYCANIRFVQIYTKRSHARVREMLLFGADKTYDKNSRTPVRYQDIYMLAYVFFGFSFRFFPFPFFPLCFTFHFFIFFIVFFFFYVFRDNSECMVPIWRASSFSSAKWKTKRPSHLKSSK